MQDERHEQKEKTKEKKKEKNCKKGKKNLLLRNAKKKKIYFQKYFIHL